MNSGEMKTAKNLQSAVAAKRFLLELANMGDRSEDAERFWRQCSEFFPPDSFRLSEEVEAELPSDRQWQPGQHTWSTSQELSSDRKSKLRQENLVQLRDWLREVWTIADPRRKEWKLFELRQKFQRLSAASEIGAAEPPPRSGMDYALRYLWRMPDKARRCANAGCSVTPYFLVERRGRTFCTETCARPAQQEYKQHWWEEHRAEMSKKRKEAYRRAKR
jgi:hypothetical protein